MWRDGLFQSRFVLEAARKDGKELQILPAELPAALAGVDIAPEAASNASPWAGAGVPHFDIGGTDDLEDIQHALRSKRLGHALLFESMLHCMFP